MSRAFRILIASAAVLSCAAPAIAQTHPESRLVTYGDLDLESRAGADALIRRIDNAAEQVCGVNDGRTDTRQFYINRACHVETAENAVNDTGHPVVISRYYGSGYAIVEEGDAYYDPRLDPALPDYDPSLDPNSPYYVPPK